TSDGQQNFDIIERSTDSTEENDNFTFRLELLEVENVEFRYRNLAAQQFYDLDVHNGLFQGDFSATDYVLTVQSKLNIKRLKSNSFSLVTNKESQLNLEMMINNPARRYLFTRGDLKIEEMPFGITGFIDSAMIDLTLAGDQIKIQDLLNSVQDRSVDGVKIYDGKGIVSFSSH